MRLLQLYINCEGIDRVLLSLSLLILRLLSDLSIPLDLTSPCLRADLDGLSADRDQFVIPTLGSASL